MVCLDGVDNGSLLLLCIMVTGTRASGHLLRQSQGLFYELELVSSGKDNAFHRTLETYNMPVLHQVTWILFFKWCSNSCRPQLWANPAVGFTNQLHSAEVSKLLHYDTVQCGSVNNHRNIFLPLSNSLLRIPHTHRDTHPHIFVFHRHNTLPRSIPSQLTPADIPVSPQP